MLIFEYIINFDITLYFVLNINEISVKPIQINGGKEVHDEIMKLLKE